MSAVMGRQLASAGAEPPVLPVCREPGTAGQGWHTPNGYWLGLD
jgi:hypothetical protein